MVAERVVSMLNTQIDLRPKFGKVPSLSGSRDIYLSCLHD